MVRDALLTPEGSQQLDGLAQSLDRLPVGHAVEAFDQPLSARAEADDDPPLRQLVERREVLRQRARRA